MKSWPISLAAHSKAWVCGHSLGMRVRIPPG